MTQTNIAYLLREKKVTHRSKYERTNRQVQYRYSVADFLWGESVCTVKAMMEGTYYNRPLSFL